MDNECNELRKLLPDPIFGQDNCETWYAEITKEKNADVFLLILFPSLKSIKWNGHTGRRCDEVLGKSILEQGKRSGPLQCLQQVSFGVKRNHRMGADLTVPYLKLDSVAAFRGGNLKEYKLMMMKNSSAVFHTKDVSLSLTNCELRAGCLKQFLLCFDLLQSFEVGEGHDTNGEYNSDYSDDDLEDLNGWRR